MKREVGNAGFSACCGKRFLNVRVPRSGVGICKNIFGITGLLATDLVYSESIFKRFAVYALRQFER